MGLTKLLPEKPGRMHWATYQRLMEKAAQAERERKAGSRQVQAGVWNIDIERLIQLKLSNL